MPLTPDSPDEPIAERVDYIPKYMTTKGLDFGRLLNDDFFNAIRLLFNQTYYASAAKLLMTFIDTAGFVEFGDTGENTFVKWLGAYADLTPVEVTAQELWEHRNSLLHLTSPDSRRVRTGKVRRLMSYVGNLPVDLPTENQNTKFYNLLSLIQAVGAACTRWAESYKKDRSKLEQFFDRYDLIVSDTRMLKVNIDDVINRSA
jgi:hypothetical protein